MKQDAKGELEIPVYGKLAEASTRAGPMSYKPGAPVTILQ